MPAFPGTVRVAGNLSATDGAVIVTEDRLSLQAGEDNLGNWSIDTLDIAHKGQVITIAVDDEVVVFMTPDADQLEKALEQGASLAAKTAKERNDKILRIKRPRIGRKASAKRKIELFDEHQLQVPEGAAAEPGADPWLRGITVTAPVLTPADEAPAPPPPPIIEEPVPAARPPKERTSKRADRAKQRDEQREQKREARQRAKIEKSEKLAAATSEAEAVTTTTAKDAAPELAQPSRRRIRLPQLQRVQWAAVILAAAVIPVAVLFPQITSAVLLGLAGIIIMVAIAGIMDQAIELRLPSQLNVTRLFGLGLGLLAVGAALGSIV